VTHALVPVKRLAASKSRLFAALEQRQREAFSLAMLQDVIEALLATPSLDRTTVVTPDEAVGQAARAAGADALVRDDPGLNAALEAGARALELTGDEPLLVILGDVAGALPEEIEALFTALAEQRGRGVVLAASRDGGTCALLRAPHDAIPARFGPDSAKRHREAAEECGVAFCETALPSLSVDLDLPEDVELFLRTGAGGSHTRATLNELGWGRAS
jgi:2-phospho-L-lactate guanylyltransferase